MDGYSIFWACAAVVFIIAEAATAALVSVWFIGGAVAALVAALFGAPLWVQIALFVVVSGALLAALRPLAKRSAANRERTNADRVVGALGLVTERIDAIAGTGAVKVDGKEWSARSVRGGVIDAGEVVRVERIEGVKVFVTEKEEKA